MNINTVTLVTGRCEGMFVLCVHAIAIDATIQHGALLFLTLVT